MTSDKIATPKVVDAMNDFFLPITIMMSNSETPSGESSITVVLDRKVEATCFNFLFVFIIVSLLHNGLHAVILFI